MILLRRRLDEYSRCEGCAVYLVQPDGERYRTQYPMEPSTTQKYGNNISNGTIK